MNEAEDPSADPGLAALRARIDAVERDYRASISSLRTELAILQKRAKPLVRLAEPEGPARVVPPPLPPPPTAPVEEPATAVAVDRAPDEARGIPIPESPAEADPEASFEIQLGKVWLVRLGIALLVTGLVLLGNYAYQNWVRELPNGVRLAALFGCAGLLFETGRRLAARPKLRNFGEVVLAGGLAFGYYCAFAAHHVARLKVIDSPVVAALLLFAAAATIGGVSWLRQAKVTAVMAFVLASYSTMLQPIGWLSCVSSVFLAAGGVAMMLRPGWAGPGIASLFGTYVAFFGWQFLGASQGSLEDPAVLWFLPPVWVLFSLPGATGRFDVSLTERARSWFTGSNNIAFFLLFSAVWRERFDEADYWLVPAVFGLVLAVMGIAGRRIERASGGVNLAHGLAALSLALVLKLDGFHLALGLAGQSLALASAFSRFRGRSEAFFSVAAGVGACALVAWVVAEPAHAATIPVWSAGLAVLLVAAAALVLRRGVDGCADGLREATRFGGALVFVAAVLAGILGWCWRLPGEWPLPVAAALATGLGAGFVFLDRERRMPEVAAGALLFLIAAAVFLIGAEAPIAIAAAVLLALAGSWVWHLPQERDEVFEPMRKLSAWFHSVFVAVAAAFFVERGSWDVGQTAFGFSLAALVLTGAGLCLRCHRLLPCVAVLGLVGALSAVAETSEWGWAFGIAICGLAAVGLLRLPWARGRCEDPGGTAEKILRGAAFVAVCLGWYRFSPDFWGDWLAGTALVVAAVAGFRKWRLPEEATGFLLAAGLWLAVEMVTTRWDPFPYHSWRGAAVVLGLLAFPMIGARGGRHDGEQWRMAGANFATAIACALAALWATQMLVWRYDWNAAAVLWSLLGFAAVSAGLWLRRVVFRQMGFVLLALAILKVFAVDVWDFTAFMRVVSFIVLGAAMTLLGLFYNRFVPAMKRLLDKG